MKKNKTKLTLSIIMPIYNEEKTLNEILKKVFDAKIPIQKEIICVDDGSKDNSANIIKEFAKKEKRIKYFRKENGGKGSALRLGLQKCSGDIIIIQDADLEYDPNDYSLLLNEILENKCDVVFGSRYMSTNGHLKENNHLTYEIHKLGNHFLSFLTTLLYFQKITDMETCYKMFTKDVYQKIRPLKSNNFNIEPEITSKILKNKFKVKEVPIHYFSRDFSEGKKITWKDGIKAVFSLIRWRVAK